MRTEPATAIGFAMRDTWADVIVADDGTDGGRRWLAVWRAPAGDVVPFVWDILPTGKLIDLIDAHGQDGLIVIDASDVVRTVLLALRSQVPA